MKYYYKYSWFSYFLLPFMGCALSAIIVLPIANLFVDGELSETANLIVVCILFLIFFIWYVYANRYKEYVELDPGFIKWGFDERSGKEDIIFSLSQILLFEVLV